MNRPLSVVVSSNHSYIIFSMAFPLFWLIHVALTANMSPWASSEWRITFNLGRDSASTGGLDETWGRSGARLALGVEVLVESEKYLDSDTERDFIGGSGASNCLSVLEDAVYVSSEKGQQTIRFGATGAWKLSTRRTGRPGDPGEIRFWLDVLDTAVRNDVILNAGERLYATAKCWREVDFDVGRRRLVPYELRAQAAQDIVDARLQHESGEHQLSGSDIVDTVISSIDMALLMQRRDETLSELRTARQKLPISTKVSKPGHWPGSTEKLFISKGTIGVKRRKGFWDVFHVVGTWTATPLDIVEGVYDYETEETAFSTQ
jgi:hypothetical protein